MKIGIVTQPLAANYGGILQNYALQRTLVKMGHTPITLRVGKKTPIMYGRHVLIYILLAFLGRKRKKPVFPYFFNKRKAGLERFVKKYINTTQAKIWFNKNDIKKYDIDALLVGSDQVWRPNYNKSIEDMFLRFAEKSIIPKIAYAASFGTEDWIFTDRQTKDCSTLLKSFKAISVREKSGLDMCKNYLRREDAVWVADPTMLLDKEEYLELCNNIPVCNEKFMFAYILDIDEKVLDFINCNANTKGLKLKLLSAQEYISKEDTIENWLAMFRDASCVITDSFHGTVFSLLFRKEFITIRNRERGNSRFNCLISAFGIEENFIDFSEYKEYVKNHMVNWDLIEQRMTCLKKRSQEFLIDSFS